MKILKDLRCLVLPLLMLAVSGCLQIDTKIYLEEDGSGTITERLTLSKKLLDMAGKGGAYKRLTAVLSREAALARMKKMGTAVTLASHKIQDSGLGSKECIVVYKTPDIRNFTYPSPYLAAGFDPGLLKITIEPIMKNPHRGIYPAGGLRVGVQHLAPKGSIPTRHKKSPRIKTLHPSELQVYRELVPVFSDMMEGFQIRVRFEAYCPVVIVWGWPRYPAHRRKLANVHYLDLLSITDKDLDKHGYIFLKNEEIMVELLRGQLGFHEGMANHGPFLADHLSGQGKNLTLPVFSGSGGVSIGLRPSRHLFKRYFEGKTLQSYDGKFPAKWEQIGYHPPKTAAGK